MAPDNLKPEQWYWLRQSDGSLAPFRFHRVCSEGRGGPQVGEFFVGSMIQRFPLNCVVAESQMPTKC